MKLWKVNPVAQEKVVLRSFVTCLKFLIIRKNHSSCFSLHIFMLGCELDASRGIARDHSCWMCLPVWIQRDWQVQDLRTAWGRPILSVGGYHLFGWGSIMLLDTRLKVLFFMDSGTWNCCLTLWPRIGDAVYFSAVPTVKLFNSCASVNQFPKIPLLHSSILVVFLWRMLTNTGFEGWRREMLDKYQCHNQS